MRCTKGIVAYRRAAGGGGAEHPSDTFDRADGLIGTASSGLVWTETIADKLYVGSNTLSIGGTRSPATAYIATLPFVSADGVLTVDMENDISLGLGGLVFRFTDTSNYLRALYQHNSGGGSLFLEKYAGGSYGLLDYATGLNLSAPVTLKVTMSGSALTVEVDDVEILSAADSFNADETNHGVLLGTLTGTTTNAYYLDDFDFLPA